MELNTIQKIVLSLIGLQHFGFLYMEMFGWTTIAPKVFRGYPEEFFHKTKAMAANQGLYNGFLAAGCLWSAWWIPVEMATHTSMFFLSCIAVAGAYGAYSVSRTILWVQGLPAIALLIWILIVS